MAIVHCNRELERPTAPSCWGRRGRNGHRIDARPLPCMNLELGSNGHRTPRRRMSADGAGEAIEKGRCEVVHPKADVGRTDCPLRTGSFVWPVSVQCSLTFNARWGTSDPDNSCSVTKPKLTFDLDAAGSFGFRAVYLNRHRFSKRNHRETSHQGR